MTTDSVSRMLLFVFMLVDVWGLLCGIDLVRNAWRLRKSSSTMQGYAEMGGYMTLNVLLWLFILAQAFIWPEPSDAPGGPKAAFLTAFFFAASLTITAALYRGRNLLVQGSGGS